MCRQLQRHKSNHIPFSLSLYFLSFICFYHHHHHMWWTIATRRSFLIKLETNNMSCLLIELTSVFVCVCDVTFFILDCCYLIYSVLDNHHYHDLDLLTLIFSSLVVASMPSGWPTSLQLVKDLDRTSCSIKSEESTSTDELDDDQNNDGEGVWSTDIEQSFHVR